MSSSSSMSSSLSSVSSTDNWAVVGSKPKKNRDSNRWSDNDRNSGKKTGVSGDKVKTYNRYDSKPPSLINLITRQPGGHPQNPHSQSNGGLPQPQPKGLPQPQPLGGHGDVQQPQPDGGVPQPQPDGGHGGVPQPQPNGGHGGVPQSHPLNDTWVLWFHDLKKDDWTLNSYEKLFSFNTIEDFWITYNNLTDLTNGMYYLMRDGYPPLWDHEKMIEGGGWTFKVNKRNLNRFWEELSCYCVGETICKDSNRVVGLSVSPKILYASVRVWTLDTDQTGELYTDLAKETANSNTVINFMTDARFTTNKKAAT